MRREFCKWLGERDKHKGTRTTSRVGDVASSLVEHSMIERLQANADILRFHVHYR